MTWAQRFFTAIFPRAWAEDMRAESRRWMVRGARGFERSVWDIGGLRWRMLGNPRWPQFGKVVWHQVYQEPG